MTVLTVDFQMAFWSAPLGYVNQTMLLLFFFSYLIQLCDSRKIHYLTRECHVKLHLKTDMALIASRFVRYRFSRAIFKDVRAHCYCASLVRTLFIGHARATSFSSARTESISFPEPTCLLVSTKTRSSAIIN